MAASVAKAQFHYNTISIDSADLPAANNNTVQVSFIPTANGTAHITYNLDLFPTEVGASAGVSVSSTNNYLFSAELINTPEYIYYPADELVTDGSPDFAVTAGTIYYLAGGGSVYNPLAFDSVGQGEFRATVSYPVSDYIYSINNGTITIIGYTGPGGAVNIPSTINGLPVTSIGAYAFEGNTTLTSVTIPSSVTSIGAGAFEYCTRLTSVTIPGSVISIGDDAFYGCTSLSAITVDSSNTSYSSGAGVLFDKRQTTLIEYSGGLVGSYTIPNGVTYIGDEAFESCMHLTCITIPNSVTSIGNDAFNGCGNLVGIFFQGNPPSLGEDVFSGDPAAVYYMPGTTGWGSTFGGLPTVLCYPPVYTYTTNNAAITITGYTGCGGALSIPSTINGLPVTSIGYSAFAQVTCLTSVTIPDSVTSIGADAFWHCTCLTSVTIPNSVTSIGEEAFGDCISLTNVTIPNSVTSIGDYAFWYCTGLTSVTIPNSVTSIGVEAFGGCTGLTSVTIPNSVTSIGGGRFGAAPA